jgi:endopeptidase La
MLYNKHIILVNRKIYLNKIDDIIKNLTSEYNNCVKYSPNNKFFNYNETHEFFNILKENDYYNLRKMVSLSKKINYYYQDNILYSNEINDPLKKSKKIVTDMCRVIGFPNICSALKILIDDDYKSYFDKEINDIICFYDKIFIPTSFTTDDITKLNNNNDLFINKDEKKNIDILLNRVFQIIIKNKRDNKFIIFNGFIKNDSNNIHIKTSQINNKLLYDKKNFLKSINSNNSIDFKKLYIKNISLYELVTLSNNELEEMIDTKYKLYNDIRYNTIQKIIDIFFDKKSITHMFNIINVLLLGNQSEINYAGILFDKLNENKKYNTVIHFSQISEIIYLNLPLSLQNNLTNSRKTIKEEINKIKINNKNDYSKELIISKNIPDYIKKITMEKINEMKTSNSDYHKQLLFVKSILNYPWPNPSNNIFDNYKTREQKISFLNNLKDNLDKLSYGHQEPKNIIIQNIAKWLSNSSSSGNILSFNGPPGVGKTRLAKNISSAIGIPFIQITLGGQNDGELLHGHSYTYSSAQPGLIIKKMIEFGSERCILFFDELDKACSKNGKTNEIMNILIHLTDESTNTAFQDRFFQGINFPLDKVIMMFSYNNSSLVDPILLDRFEEIKFKSYTNKDKLNIVKNFIINDLIESVNLQKYNINISDDNIEFIINNYTCESGVRDIKRKIKKILLELNIDRIYNRGLFLNNDKNIHINKHYIKKILGKEYYNDNIIHNNPIVGIINGLYATNNGHGGILPLEFSKNYVSGRFDFILTGNLGNIMSESIKCAYTSAINYIKNKFDNNIDDIIKSTFSNGYHIHAKECSTPKDGPSAGCAFTVGFISLIMNYKIKNDIAITGEIDIHGNITKIGGLIYKLIGAKKAGIKKVYLPKDNQDDIDEIIHKYPELFDSCFNYKYITILDDLIDEVLIYS